MSFDKTDNDLFEALLRYVLKYREEYQRNNVLGENDVFYKLTIPNARLFGLDLEFGNVVNPTITTRQLTKQEIDERDLWANAFIERHIK